MIKLLKFEQYKTFHNKINILAIIALIIWTMFIIVSSVIQESSISSLSEIRLTGYDAIEFQKENYASDEVTIDNMYFNDLLLRLQSYNTNPNITDFEAAQIINNGEFSSDTEIIRFLVSVYSQNNDILDRSSIFKISLPVDVIQDWKTVSGNNNPDISGFSYEYSLGFQKFCKLFKDYFLGISIIISIIFSNLFTEQKENNIQEIIDTTRMTGYYVCYSKILNSFLSTSFLYLVSLLIFSAGIFGIYGFGGAGVNIQFSLNNTLPIILHNWEAMFLLIVIGWLGIIFICFLSFTLSTLLKSSKKGMLVAFLISIVPYFLTGILSQGIVKCFFPAIFTNLNIALNLSLLEITVIILTIFSMGIVCTLRERKHYV